MKSGSKRVLSLAEFGQPCRRTFCFIWFLLSRFYGTTKHEYLVEVSRKTSGQLHPLFYKQESLNVFQVSRADLKNDYTFLRL